MTLYEQLLEDLAAEQAALDAVLGGITDTQRDLPIPVRVPPLVRQLASLGFSTRPSATASNPTKLPAMRRRMGALQSG